MTRVIYWNIEKFSATKINVASPNPLLAMQSTGRLNLIEGVFAPWLGGGEEEMEWQELPPDIFVVVEVSARTDPVIPEGLPLFGGSGGGRGVRQLLQALRNEFGAHWSLVPPIFLGREGFREGVAVFYNAETVMFEGPYVLSHPAGYALPTALPATVANIETIQNYGAVWNAGFPGGGRTWEFEEGVHIPESQSAGQWAFYAGGNRIYFPGESNRSPFYTRFLDIATGRRLKLFSVHTSPSSANQAVERLALIPELVPAENEVSLIVGDFNVDTFGAQAARYNGLLENNFRLLLDSRAPGAEVPDLNRKPYCMTHLLPIAQARPWNVVGVPNPDTTHNAYPRYGYMGSTLPGGGLSEAGAIDNALVRYGPGGAGEPKASVVNPVVGTPYNQVAEPPEGVTAELTTGAPYRRSMANEIPQPEGVEAPNDIPGEFRSWENFGRIRSTSDHLPLVVEV